MDSLRPTTLSEDRVSVSDGTRCHQDLMNTSLWSMHGTWRPEEGKCFLRRASSAWFSCCPSRQVLAEWRTEPRLRARALSHPRPHGTNSTLYKIQMDNDWKLCWLSRWVVKDRIVNTKPSSKKHHTCIDGTIDQGQHRCCLVPGFWVSSYEALSTSEQLWTYEW